jgi:superfamily II DNA/RNA helicase
LYPPRPAEAELVFGRTKHGVKKLARDLALRGYPVAALQGNMSQNARERVVAAFRAGTLPVLLATNVAARGLDICSIEQVINYELPESAELFTHRVGRTGRMDRFYQRRCRDPSPSRYEPSLRSGRGCASFTVMVRSLSTEPLSWLIAF